MEHTRKTVAWGGSGNGATNINATSFTDITASNFTIEDNAVIALNMSGYAGPALIEGDSFRLINAATYGNPNAKITFNISGYTLGDRLGWDWSTFAADGTLRVKKIPEPSATMLSMAGISSIMFRRRRK